MPRFGKKTSCYQLTIEPDLNDVSGEEPFKLLFTCVSDNEPFCSRSHRTKDSFSDEKEIQENNGAVPMNAAKILKRKKIFLNLLAATAKEHHRVIVMSVECWNQCSSVNQTN